jgi:protein-tyrosine phosphatase
MTCDDAGFHILVVCTGNLCRSPMAERLLRAALGPGGTVSVGSAGTRAAPGRPMAPHAAEALLEYGVTPGDFASRPLTGALLDAADVVLTATREHRAEIVSRRPRCAPRTFTITEFGVLADHVLAAGGELPAPPDPAGRAAALVEEVRSLRGLVPVERPDVPDPYRRPRRAHRAAARQIADAIAGPLRALTGGSPSGVTRPLAPTPRR